MLKPGRFGLREQNPIVLKPGVSLQGSDNAPTIFTVLKNDANEAASIQGIFFFYFKNISSIKKY